MQIGPHLVHILPLSIYCPYGTMLIRNYAYTEQCLYGTMLIRNYAHAKQYISTKYRWKWIVTIKQDQPGFCPSSMISTYANYGNRCGRPCRGYLDLPSNCLRRNFQAASGIKCSWPTGCKESSLGLWISGVGMMLVIDRSFQGWEHIQRSYPTSR